MLRIALLLLIAGGLVIFALQNLTPLPLVVLGVSTQALPLALWVLGAIAAGVISTLSIATLFKVSNSMASPRATRRTPPQRPSPNGSATSTAWGTSGQRQARSSPPTDGFSASASSARKTTINDDWEPQPVKEEWEDWEGYEDAAPSRSAANSSYSAYQATEPQPVKEEWEDWDEFEEPQDAPRSVSDMPQRPARTDFEVRQEPKARYQEGSIYSYSYRQPPETEPSQSDSEPAVAPVYDAEYRVITPPYHPEPEEAQSPLDEEDWEEDVQDKTDDDADRETRPEWGDR